MSGPGYGRRLGPLLISRRWWSGAILCGVLSGCGGQEAPVPSERFHRLIVGAPTTVYDTPRLAGAMDKPHGLREAFLIDADGYLWVPGVGIEG